jgi:chromosome partitioning protein
MALLVSAARSGLRVLGINADEQATLDRWARRRRELRATDDGASFVDVPIERLSVGEYRQIRDRRGYDVIVVDTPPGHVGVRNSVQGLCELADLVLIPTTASDIDLDEVVPFRRRVAGQKAFFVLNAVNPRTVQYRNARGILLKAGKLCPADVPRLESIQAQYAKGLACTDEGEKGAEAFEAVWDFARHELGIPSRKEELADG